MFSCVRPLLTLAEFLVCLSGHFDAPRSRHFQFRVSFLSFVDVFSAEAVCRMAETRGTHGAFKKGFFRPLSFFHSPSRWGKKSHSNRERGRGTEFGLCAQGPKGERAFERLRSGVGLEIVYISCQLVSLSLFLFSESSSNVRFSFLYAIRQRFIFI